LSREVSLAIYDERNEVELSRNAPTKTVGAGWYGAEELRFPLKKSGQGLVSNRRGFPDEVVGAGMLSATLQALNHRALMKRKLVWFTD
jgi:hypothetical protein